MSNDQNEPHDCPNCETPMKRATFRTGSMAMPKREEDCCGDCGCHTPAEPTPEPTDDD